MAEAEQEQKTASSASSLSRSFSPSSLLLLSFVALSTLLISAIFLSASPSASSSILSNPWLLSFSFSAPPPPPSFSDSIQLSHSLTNSSSEDESQSVGILPREAVSDPEEGEAEEGDGSDDGHAKGKEEVTSVAQEGEDQRAPPPWALNNKSELSSSYGDLPPSLIQGELKPPDSYDSSSSPSSSTTTSTSSSTGASRSISDSREKCDISVGKWVKDGENYPLYAPGSCPFVDEGFNCQPNGRPDDEYLKWRWESKDCPTMPRFDAGQMLERLRGKRLVFAGDSLMRNQWESMLCLLREGLANKSRMIESRGSRISKGKGDYVFKFLDYDARVEFYRSHFLVAEGKRRAESGRQRLTLRLDAVAKTCRKWRGADILVFTTGHWWNHGKTSKGKDYFQEGNTVYPSLPVMEAFRRAMTTWASWVDANIDPERTRVFFCGYSPSHFRGGQWNSGGHCHDERDPIFNDSLIPSYPDKMYVIEDIIGRMKTRVEIINITRFSELRKDAHPSVYGQDARSKQPRREDCSHWCLPGVPDIWNEALQSLL